MQEKNCMCVCEVCKALGKIIYKHEEKTLYVYIQCFGVFMHVYVCVCVCCKYFDRPTIQAYMTGITWSCDPLVLL